MSTPVRSMKKRKTEAPQSAAPARAPRAPKKSGELALPPECIVADAIHLKAQLNKLVSKPVVTLDAAAVKRVDTASLQLLTAFVRERQKDGKAVEWRATDGAFADAARLLGLNALLGLDPPSPQAA